MKITGRGIESFIQAPPSDVKAILLYGPNEGKTQQYLKTLSKHVVEDINDPFNVCALTSEAIAETPAIFHDETAALSLMGGKRLITISPADKKITAALKEFLQSDHEDCLVLLTAGELSPSDSLRKLFETEKNAAVIACYLDEERDISSRIRELCQHAGYGIDQDALIALNTSIAGDSAVLVKEVEKITLYKGWDEAYKGMEGEPLRKKIGTITAEDVAKCNPNIRLYSMDELVNAATNGQNELATRIMHKFIHEGVAPIAMLRAFLRHFKRLHLIKSLTGEGEGYEEAVKKLKPPVFYKYKQDFSNQVRAWPIERIEKILENTTEYEAKSKESGQNPERLCAHLILTITRMSRT